MLQSLVPRCFAKAAFCPGVGVRVSVVNHVSGRFGDGGPRGAVTGFSRASARRFRDWLFAFAGSSGGCYSVTLTVRKVSSPQQWRRNIDVYFRRLVRRGDCGFWRVELQRRGTPHLHCLFWSSDFELLRLDWLDVWGVRKSIDHLKHAVHLEASGSSAWLGYMAAHAIKHKRTQLGWHGRQWGVVGRRFLHPRQVESFVVPFDVLSDAVDEFNRYLDYQCLWSGLPAVASWTRFCSNSVQDAFRECLAYAFRKNAFEMALEMPS